MSEIGGNKDLSILTGSFKDEERERAIFTLPNFLTAARVVGGLALGYGVAKGYIGAKEAFGGAALLIASDAEGSLINIGKRLPRKVRDSLRLWPSKYGRITDPIADKVFAVALLGGGLVSGTVPAVSGAAILGSEAATTGVTMRTTKRNNNQPPEVPRVGKMGAIARFGAIAAYFASPAVSNEQVSEALTVSGHGFTAAAVALGALSAKAIWDQANNFESEQI